MPEHGQQDLIEAVSLLFDAAGNVRRTVSEDIEAKSGIPRKWYEALSRAQRHPPGQWWHVSELAVQMSLPQSSMTRLLDQLEEEGYVLRVADPANRRSTLIEMTPLGDQAVESGLEVFLSSTREHFVGLLTDEQLDHLVRITQILRDANAPRPDLPD
jgi:DNA-binding MarR family transcriptional regulator